MKWVCASLTAVSFSEYVGPGVSVVVVIGAVVVEDGTLVVEVVVSEAAVGSSSETCSSWPHPTNTENTTMVAAKKRLRDVPICRPTTIQPSHDLNRLESPEPQR